MREWHEAHLPSLYILCPPSQDFDGTENRTFLFEQRQMLVGMIGSLLIVTTFCGNYCLCRMPTKMVNWKH
jgi:hypothetical protein